MGGRTHPSRYDHKMDFTESFWAHLMVIVVLGEGKLDIMIISVVSSGQASYH